MKYRTLLKGVRLFLVTILGMTILSCDKEDDRIDDYKNLNRSEELKGWWRQINEEDENPQYFLFEDFIFKTVSYTESHGYYIPPEGDYWYNTDIYLLSSGKPGASGVETKMPYKLNETNDTLRVWNNPPGYYVKSVQP